MFRLLKIRRISIFLYFIVVINLLVVACSHKIKEKQIPLLEIKKALASNHILKDEDVSNMPFAKHVTIAKACRIMIYSRDSCFEQKLKSEKVDDLFKYMLKHNKYGVFEMLEGKSNIPKNHFTIYVYPLMQNTFVGYIREYGKRLTDYEFQFYIIFENGEPVCSKVYKMSGSIL